MCYGKVCGFWNFLKKCQFHSRFTDFTALRCAIHPDNNTTLFKMPLLFTCFNITWIDAPSSTRTSGIANQNSHRPNGSLLPYCNRRTRRWDEKVRNLHNKNQISKQFPAMHPFHQTHLRTKNRISSLSHNRLMKHRGPDLESRMPCRCGRKSPGLQKRVGKWTRMTCQSSGRVRKVKASRVAPNASDREWNFEFFWNFKKPQTLRRYMRDSKNNGDTCLTWSGVDFCALSNGAYIESMRRSWNRKLLKF